MAGESGVGSRQFLAGVGVRFMVGLGNWDRSWNLKWSDSGVRIGVGIRSGQESMLKLNFPLSFPPSMSMHLYKRVRPSVRWSVHRSIGHTFFVLLKSARNAMKTSCNWLSSTHSFMHSDTSLFGSNLFLFFLSENETDTISRPMPHTSLDIHYRNIWKIMCMVIFMENFEK